MLAADSAAHMSQGSAESRFAVTGAAWEVDGAKLLHRPLQVCCILGQNGSQGQPAVTMNAAGGGNTSV
jgi:hypothetical protein